MSVTKYYNTCYRIAKAQGVFLICKKHDGKIAEGRMTGWHEINETECLVDISFGTGNETHNIHSIISYRKGKEITPWPKYVRENKLFE
jgi:hypothetical protein